MSLRSRDDTEAAIAEATHHIEDAAAAKKCWPCGCLHQSLQAIERALPADERPEQITGAIRSATDRLTAVRYECLGCEVCYPALAINALAQAGASVDVSGCASASVTEREGWPPLPGDYHVLRYRAPVAICTLTDGELAAAVAERAISEVSIAGTLQTENLGIERLIMNVLANPHIRFLIVCGADSRQAIGHLPGRSLVTLARSGLNDRGRIIGAAGKRPVLRNIPDGAVEHLRHTVEVIDLTNNDQLSTILAAAQDCGRRDPGPAKVFSAERVLAPERGYLPERMVSDPAGYFVIYLDRARGMLSIEHYRNDGLLDAIIEGTTAAELYVPAVERGLVSRLDHAAYLGRELARSEHALNHGESYVQDAAPEQPVHGVTDRSCATACER